MERRLSPRFGIAVTVIALAAVVAILLELERSVAVAAIFLAWVAFTGLELLVARLRPAAPAAVASGEEEQPVAGAEPFAPEEPDGATAEQPRPLAASPFDEAEPAAEAVEPEPVYTTTPGRVSRDEEERPE